jgi:hypothetical protein
MARNDLGHWVPGTSGNPGGRPKPPDGLRTRLVGLLAEILASKRAAAPIRAFPSGDFGPVDRPPCNGQRHALRLVLMAVALQRLFSATRRRFRLCKAIPGRAYQRQGLRRRRGVEANYCPAGLGFSGDWISTDKLTVGILGQVQMKREHMMLIGVDTATMWTLNADKKSATDEQPDGTIQQAGYTA